MSPIRDGVAKDPLTLLNERIRLILGPRNMDRNGRNDYPFAIWEDKNFEVPKVQWDTRSSFPLDLNKEERRAKDRVVNLEPRSGEESMRLDGNCY
jgi:hypothetical protein